MHIPTANGLRTKTAMSIETIVDTAKKPISAITIATTEIPVEYDNLYIILSTPPFSTLLLAPEYPTEPSAKTDTTPARPPLQ